MTTVGFLSFLCWYLAILKDTLVSRGKKRGREGGREGGRGSERVREAVCVCPHHTEY